MKRKKKCDASRFDLFSLLRHTYRQTDTPVQFLVCPWAPISGYFAKMSFFLNAERVDYLVFCSLVVVVARYLANQTMIEIGFLSFSLLVEKEEETHLERE